MVRSIYLTMFFTLGLVPAARAAEPAPEYRVVRTPTTWLYSKKGVIRPEGQGFQAMVDAYTSGKIAVRSFYERKFKEGSQYVINGEEVNNWTYQGTHPWLKQEIELAQAKHLQARLERVTRGEVDEIITKIPATEIPSVKANLDRILANMQHHKGTERKDWRELGQFIKKPYSEYSGARLDPAIIGEVAARGAGAIAATGLKAAHCIIS